MPSLLKSVTDLLGQGDVFATLGQLMGGDKDQAEAAAGASVPALIGGLASRATADDGPAAITELLDGSDSGPVDDLAGFLDAGDDTAGNGMLDTILGGDRKDLVAAIGSKAEIDGSMITKLLPMLTPLVVGRLAKLRTEDKLDEAGVMSLLASEKDDLEGDGLLDTVGDFLSGGFGKAAGAAAAVAGAGAMLGSAAKDKAGDIGDAAGDAAGAVTDAAGDAKDAVVTKLGGAKDAVAGGGGGGAVDDDRNGGLGWLWWALGAVVLVLFLAWALSKCNETDEADGDKTAATEDTDEDAQEDADADDAADEDADAADDDAADDAADDDAAEDTDAAEDQDAEDAMADDDAVSTEADLQLVLAAALDGSGVTASVADGEVTLTGTAETADIKEGLVLAIGAIDGVDSVDDQIEVAGSAADDEGSDQDDDSDQDADEDQQAADEPEAGDTINDLLGLDPVTFAVSSARITDEGQLVLDEAAAYLEANPDVSVEIGGHTDDDGTVAENQVLSQRRADAVKAYLEGEGIDGDRMEAVGYGEEEPKVPNTTSLGKAENRRIEFTIL